MTDAPATRHLDGVERDLELIALAVADTRVALSGGGVIDLAGLDDRIAAICATLEGQPPEASRALLPRLLALVQDLNELSAACERARADTSLELERVSTRNRASQAYGRQPIPFPPPPEPSGE
ncbi:hypothetical protein N825_21405 [Skermanella stibiiresistens SB22]|uniref:Flagellar protein FlgN n=1 Tax=Skermanella stibiiresistens SB22 TaxID=1385369 RepID=W9GXI6_9PROT|nr:hypothetical protein [Skermanella stibiiresistens]EWY37147.1 hypothetical protein N825_21405 [Skermanella stibiiresistens SB22]